MRLSGKLQLSVEIKDLYAEEDWPSTLSILWDEIGAGRISSGMQITGCVIKVLKYSLTRTRGNNTYRSILDADYTVEVSRVDGEAMPSVVEANKRFTSYLTKTPRRITDGMVLNRLKVVGGSLSRGAT
jgi:hypothetical protein